MNKVKWLTLGTSLMGAAAVTCSAQATLLNFDDVTSSSYYQISQGSPTTYDGLVWYAPDNDIGIVNPLGFYNIGSLSQVAGRAGYGYANGMVSGPNVMDIGDGSSVSAISGQMFDFNSGYFTPAWNDNVTITLNGYNQGNLIDTASFTLNSESPTLETFNWTGLTEVIFNNNADTPFICADNLAFNLTEVPEPATLAMGAAGAAVLVLLRRKK